jgi:branched-chain amino acid aminotransferase
VGDGVFETAMVLDGVPFALTRHLERLARSATALGLTADLDLARSAVDAVLAANDLPPRARLRITLTGGEGPYGSERGSAEPTLIVATAPAKAWPATADVTVVPWARNERSAVTGVKTTSYAENVVALAYAQQRGAAEAIFGNTAGNLCEGTGSNIFVVLGGRLLTPPLSSGCLAGVSRELVLEWVGGDEVDLPLSVLEDADELFLTSSTRDVQPIARVDDRLLPAAPGIVTKGAMEVFAERQAADLDP